MIKVLKNIFRGNISPFLRRYKKIGTLYHIRLQTLSIIHEFCQKKNKFQSDHSLIQLHNNFRYEEYIQNLKSKEWVDYQISKAFKLQKSTANIKNLNYNHLRSTINQLLFLIKIITDAKSYNLDLIVNIDSLLNQATELLKLTFSEQSNLSHQSVYQQQKSNYVCLEYGLYFQMKMHWNIKIEQQMLKYYLHSYMHLLYERNLIKYVNIYDILRQQRPTEAIQHILDRSQNKLIKTFQATMNKIRQEVQITPLEMTIFLKNIRLMLSQQIDDDIKNLLGQSLLRYIQTSSPKYEQSLGHCQNLIFCLYYLIKEFQNQIRVIELLQKIIGRIIKYKRQGNYDNFAAYLTIFGSHEDKLSCLKLEIMFQMLQNELGLPEGAQSQQVLYHLKQCTSQVEHMNLTRWQCKYFFWIADSLLRRCNRQYKHFLKPIFKHLPSISYRATDKFTSIIYFLAQLINKCSQSINQMIDIHESIIRWLIHAPEDVIKSQKTIELCEFFTLADSHPSLQQIYAPFLAKIIEISLGHFEWTQFTRIYYYGLRFGVQKLSQESKWNMEYVRRYILNEYATMGLRRRQIPQDSYFYKIIGISTPQKFYQNYLQPKGQ